MTTKERLHKLVDELTDVEAEQALHVIASRRDQAAQDRSSTKTRLSR